MPNKEELNLDIKTQLDTMMESINKIMGDITKLTESIHATQRIAESIHATQRMAEKLKP